MKTCSKCGETKPLTEFAYRKDNNSYRNECKSCKASIDKEYREANKDRIAARVHEKYLVEGEKKRDYEKKRYQENTESIKKKANEYYHANKEKCSTRQRIYENNRRKNDPMFKVIRNLKGALYSALQNKTWKKDTHFAEYIGVNEYNELKSYLEAKFTEGMTWDNYGKWHIDHIYPVSRAENYEHLIKLCHYTNLQPLWAEDNLKKGNKI